MSSNTQPNKKGLLIVISGPSGVGKGTVLKEYLTERADSVYYSVSATTRNPRPGEQNGVHYHFVTVSEFEKLIEQDGVLEYAKYSGNYYGTPKAPVEKALNEGRDVILEIEVQGAQKVLEKMPEAVSVFVMPPSMAELKRRLVDRNTEDEQTVKRRLDAAVDEMKKAHDYDYIVINDTVDSALCQLRTVIAAAKTTAKKQKDFIDEVILNA